MILLTGATGFLGRELLGRLLLTRTEKIAILVRNSGRSQAAHRSEALLNEIFGEREAQRHAPRVEVVAGDASLENFGLGQSEFEKLAREVSSVYHCAASTQLSQPIEDATAINCGGTEQVLKLLRLGKKFDGKKRSIFHVSTAYVAGATKGQVTADTLGKSFRNSYEHTKAEAERMVYASSSELETCIFRPSIIVGDSVTGQTSAFNVLYMPARMVISGVCKALPAVPDTPFDVVPVDYVSDAIIQLSSLENRRKNAYHLTVGVGRESSPHEILIHLLDTFSRYHEAANAFFIAPSRKACEAISRAWLSNGALRQSVQTLERILGTRLQAIINQVLPFVPYMLENPRFCTEDTTAELQGTLNQPPQFESYAENIFSYCLETNWGKTPWENPNNRLHWTRRESYLCGNHA